MDGAICFCRDSVLPVTTRVCFIVYEDSSSVGVAQHLTNTVFIDRALVIVAVPEGKNLL